MLFNVYNRVAYNTRHESSRFSVSILTIHTLPDKIITYKRCLHELKLRNFHLFRILAKF